MIQTGIAEPDLSPKQAHKELTNLPELKDRQLQMEEQNHGIITADHKSDRYYFPIF